MSKEADIASRPSSAKSLGPLKTRQSTPEAISTSSASTEMNSKDPLPPISAEPRHRSSHESRPRIVSYHREISSKDDEELTERNEGCAAVMCQTEWSWMEDMKQHQKIRATRRISVASSVMSPRSDSDNDDEELSSAHSSARERVQKVSVVMDHMNRAEEGSVTSSPYPSRDDEYGIPILHLDSESEHSSDEDSMYQYKYIEGEEGEEGEDKKPQDQILPSIGPPEILKYQRESTKVEGTPNEEAVKVADQEGTSGGMFEGICEFCHESIRPFPSMEDQKKMAPEDLYCCNSYRDFVQFIITHPLHDAEEKKKRDEQIDIKPHPPYGSKQARKDAKERAAQRMRERELARQQAAMAAGISGPTPAGGGGGGAGGSNFYQFARQMKTINYQLSSQKCLEDGWTVRPPSPLFDPLVGCEVFEPEPLLPPWAESSAKQTKKRSLILKYYDDGHKFITLFPDGTGTVFYPSGRVAITISSVELGLYTYIAQDDTPDQNVLAVFKSDGHAICNYYHHGTVRLHLDQIGGIELDQKGGRRRKWHWKEQIEHVHAPPIQPITFALSPIISVRLKGQESISLTFTYAKYSCRFQVGARLKPISRQPTQIGEVSFKLVGPQYAQPPSINMDDLYRKECLTTIQTLLDKVNNLLRFPNSPKVDRFPTPQHLVTRMRKIEEVKFLRSSRVKGKKGEGEIEDDSVEESVAVISVN